MKLKRSNYRFLLVLSVFAVVCTASLSTWLYKTSASSFSGAVRTTVNDGTGVNVNQFDDASHAYFYGSSLPDGTYYYQVTTPNGTLLSTDDAVCRQLTVAGGVFTGSSGPACKHLNGLATPTGSVPVQLLPFATTTNNGGGYKVWLIRAASTTTIDSVDPKVIHFATNNAKTDNFKIKEASCDPNSDPSCPSTVTLSGTKFYDADADGVKDAGEIGVEGVKITVTLPNLEETTTVTTDADGNWSVSDIPNGADYVVEEILPETCLPNTYWVQTAPVADADGNQRYEGTANGNVSSLDFGNLSFYPAQGGKTLGFWSNKNGRAVMSSTDPNGVDVNVFPVWGSEQNPPNPTPAADGAGLGNDLAFLTRLNLKESSTNRRFPNGEDFNPANYDSFRSWLLSGSSTNMAYMLSVQLSATSLNARHKFIFDSQIVDARSVGLGLIRIGDVRLLANQSLANHTITISGDPHRQSQEQMKNFLDAVNRNVLPFASSVPIGVCYPEVEETK